MAIFELFSKRQKLMRGETHDVYIYDNIPKPLRVQLIQIIEEGFGIYRPGADAISNDLHKILCREYGVFTLTDARVHSKWEAIVHHLLETQEVDRVIDIVEISLKIIDVHVRDDISYGEALTPDNVIEEANIRFKEHGVGYEYANQKIIRVDSKHVHSQVIIPALALLSGKMYQGANDEYLKAHEHYRHGRHKECLNDCLKSFESTLKTICKSKKWKYNDTDTAKRLIAVCIDNHLIPNFMENHLNNLKAILESGIPTVRNKKGAHGQGVSVTKVTEPTARFALNLTASNILLFAESADL